MSKNTDWFALDKNSGFELRKKYTWGLLFQ